MWYKLVKKDWNVVWGSLFDLDDGCSDKSYFLMKFMLLFAQSKVT